MIRAHRAERVIENLHNIPDRGTLDEYDRPSEGLGPKKLKDSILSDPELHHLQTRPAYIPNTVGQSGQIRSLHNDVKLTRENVLGEVVQSGNITSVAKGKVEAAGTWPETDIPQLSKGKIQAAGVWQKYDLPGDIQYGKVGKANIENNGVHPSDHIDWTVPKDDFIPIRMLESRPWPSQSSVNAKTSRNEAEQIARAVVNKIVKKSARTN